MKNDHSGAKSGSEQSRRLFLRRTLLGSVILTLTPRALLGSRSLETDRSLAFFDRDEFTIFTAIADRIVGPRPHSAPSGEAIAQRADAFLAGAHPEIQDQFHLLLPLFNSAVIAFLFDMRLSSFLNMTPDEQDSYLDGWMRSSLAFRRTAFQGLKRVAMSVYYSHEGSWEPIGFDGDYAKR